MNSYKIWALLGAIGGAGFGLVVTPLIFILVNLSSDGVTLGETVGFALANGVAWGALGLFAGIFLGVINTVKSRPVQD